MNVLYFDCFSGAAGDMICAALIDAGADFEAIESALQSLGVEGYSLRIERVKKQGVMATRFVVDVDTEHGHAHRHLHHIEEIIGKGNLPEPVKMASLETFRRIAVCEAEVHGTTPEKIHFHEVGAVDSIVDIVGCHLALHQLKPDRVVSSAVHVGAGTVKCAHGVMPVPAPATALLLRGVPSYGGEVQAELVTPTGAALIAQIAEEFGPLPVMKVEAVGVGGGAKDLPDRPNILRVFIGEQTAAQATEPITIVEANVDDMNPELFPPLLEDLTNAGARDAFLTPIVGKKGRPAYTISVMVYAQDVPRIADVLFQGSTTIGLRMRQESRICLARRAGTVQTPWGEVRIKIAELNGNVKGAAPEYDECARMARAAGVPVLKVYETALAAAIKGEYKDA